MNCLSSLGGLNTLASFSLLICDLYPVEHPQNTSPFRNTIYKKTHHPNLKKEIIKLNNEMESIINNGKRFTSDNSR
jgi:hypothetical protein